MTRGRQREEDNQGAVLDRAPSVATPHTVAPPVAKFAESYRIKRVVDGHTLVLLLDGRETGVRPQGVDTPETVHPQKAVKAREKEASRFTKNLLGGELVYPDYEGRALMW